MRILAPIFYTLFLLINSPLYANFSSAQIEQAKAMVAKDPSLLNSRKAQEMLKNYKEQQGSLTQNKDQEIIPIENNISNTNTQNQIYLEDQQFNFDDFDIDQNFIEKKTIIQNRIDPQTGEYIQIKEFIRTNEDNNTGEIVLNRKIIETKEEEKKYQNINEMNDIDLDQSIRLTPLKYQTNQEELKKIKSIHKQREYKKLERFSKEFFRNKNRVATQSVSAPDNYVIKKGDVLTFWIYGSTNEKFELGVNNQGNINIEQIGPVHVGGEKFIEVKTLLTNYLSSSYKNSRVVVDINSLTNAQVTVTGFINAPGIYNTEAVSSVKDILIRAQGVDDRGSVRKIYVRRDGKIIAKIDYYHLLSMGLDHGDFILQSGDTIHVTRAYGIISIEGAVNKEALYEIESGESLAHILQIAGGLKANADGYSIEVKRYQRNSQIKHYTLSIAQARRFITKDGDEVFIHGMNSTNERYVKLLGNIDREGKRELSGNNMKLSTLLKRELRGGKLDSLFLENTRFDYAMVKRIQPDLSYKVLNVNLQSILDGVSDFTLQNRDEIYIFNRLDTGENPFVTISGSPLMQSGKFLFNEGMTLIDLINQAGIKSPYDKKKVKVVQYSTDDMKPEVSIINIEENPNFHLKERDEVTLFDFYDTHPLNSATINGEVVSPGQYVVSEGMVLSTFITSAGGLSERAYPKECEIIRYHLENGERKKKIFNIKMEDAQKFLVQKHDEINIKRIPYWSERKVVTIEGEVKFPGEYIIHSGERLDSVIKRAGGFTEEAFLYGAVFSRKSIASMQQESLKKSLSKLKEQIILTSLKEKDVNMESSIKAVESLIKEAEELTLLGRISINIDPELQNFQNSESNLALKDGDKLTIPSFNDTILVSGEVMSPTAMTHLGDDINDYISKSGGLTDVADINHIYVIHANGEAEKASIGSYLFASNHVDVRKGDVIVVPKKLVFDTNMDIAGSIADIFYKLTLTVASLHTVGAL